jgi:hypothetical protein
LHGSGLNTTFEFQKQLMSQSNKICIDVLHIILAPNYNNDVDGLSGIGNVNYTYDALRQFNPRYK